jgi:hypothetical protein
MKLELIKENELCTTCVLPDCKSSYCAKGFDDGKKQQCDADQLILDRAEWLISYLIDVCQEWKTDYDKLDAELAKKDKHIDELVGAMGKHNDLMLSYIELGERNTELQAEIEVLKAQLKNQTEIAQKYEDRYFSSKAEIANAESVAWDLQKQIEVLKANDIRTLIPDGKYCLPDNAPDCRFHCSDLSGASYCAENWRHIRLTTDSTCKITKCESCPKPDKGEVKA